MSWQIVGAEHWQTQPWKNGGGVTHEILREMANDHFGWRLSLAEINSDGPFSSFPDIDRVITLVEGNGFTLNIDQQTVTLNKRGEFHPFAGEATTSCRLLNGPVRDLNLMCHRQYFRAEVQCHSHQHSRLDMASADRHLVFVLAGAIQLQRTDGDCTLRTLQTALSTDGEAYGIRSLEPGSQWLQMALFRK